MDFRVLDRRSVDRKQWEQLAERGSFFHTVTWADICVDGLAPHAEAVFLCGFENGRMAAGMPAIITRHIGLGSFYSMPYGTYGEAIFAEGVPGNTREEFSKRVKEYLIENNFSRIAITDSRSNFIGLNGSTLHRKKLFTHIISLNGSGNYQPPDKKIAGHLRTGKRADTDIMHIRKPGQLDEFYELYRLTERRHGKHRPLYGRKFFESILSNMNGSKDLVWSGLMADGEMVGSSINFIHHKTLFNWQTVSDYDKRKFKPNHILLYEAIHEGIEQGVERVNLGASPYYSKGLIDYKERWGGVRFDYDFYFADSWIRRIIRR